MFAQGGSLAKGDLSRKSKICGRNVSLVNLELETMMSLDTHDYLRSFLGRGILLFGFVSSM